MDQYEVTFAGFGGQGVMTAGQLLAYSGMAEGKQVVWLPSYGPEMRGGTAYCTVVVSDERIGSPVINSPRAICVFNRPSFDKFGPRVKPGGLFIINSSLIELTCDRTDLTQLKVPANDIAMKAGNPKATNLAILGAFVGATSTVNIETLKQIVIDKLGRKKEFLAKNLKVLEQGYQLAMETLGQGQKA